MTKPEGFARIDEFPGEIYVRIWVGSKSIGGMTKAEADHINTAFEKAVSLRVQEAVKEAYERANEVVMRYLRAYPADVFIMPPPGKHGESIDSCSARAIRIILPRIISDIRALKEIRTPEAGK